MKRKATARWRVHLTRGWLRTALSLCALLALLSMLALFTSGGPLPVQIAAVPQGGAVYLLEEWEDLCLLAYGGSQAGSGAVMALDRRTGQAVSQTGFSGRLVWAALRGDSVFALEEGENGAVLSQLSLPELNLVGGWALPAAVEERALFDCDGAGRFITRMPKAPCGFLTWEGSRGKWEGCTGVSFLEVTPQGTAAAFTASGFFWGPSQDPGAWQSCLLPFSPFCLLGEEHFLDQLGYLNWYGSGNVELVRPRPRGGLSFGPDALRFGPGRAVPVPQRGGPLGGVRHPGGRGCGLCARKGRAAGPVRQRCPVAGGERLLVSANPVLSGTAHPIARAHTGANAYPAPSETPAPSLPPRWSRKTLPRRLRRSPRPLRNLLLPQSPLPLRNPRILRHPPQPPAPTESPSPSPSSHTGGIVQEDSYLLMPQGVTVDTLLAYFAPDAVLIQTPEGGGRDLWPAGHRHDRG